jgi:hypothetical protein
MEGRKYKYITEYDNGRNVIGMTEFGFDRLIAILLGLKYFPVEIQEKIVYTLILSAFREWYILKIVSQMIKQTIEAEKVRSMNQDMQEFLEYLENLDFPLDDEIVTYLVESFEDIYDNE